jgi:hypothetical protein
MKAAMAALAWSRTTMASQVEVVEAVELARLTCVSPGSPLLRHAARGMLVSGDLFF